MPADTQVSRSTEPVRKQAACQSSLVKQQPLTENNPLKMLKEGCESPRRNYKYNMVEVPLRLDMQSQKFMFKVNVKDKDGRVLYEGVGSKENNKRLAKHDAAKKAIDKLRLVDH